jgi:hypothetical protein
MTTSGGLGENNKVAAAINFGFLVYDKGGRGVSFNFHPALVLHVIHSWRGPPLESGDPRLEANDTAMR